MEISPYKISNVFFSAFMFNPYAYIVQNKSTLLQYGSRKKAKRQKASRKKSHSEICHPDINPLEKKKHQEISLPNKKPPGNWPPDKSHPEKSHPLFRHPIKSLAVNKPAGQKSTQAKSFFSLSWWETVMANELKFLVHSWMSNCKCYLSFFHLRVDLFLVPYVFL